MDSDSSINYEPSEVGHPGDTVVDYLEFNGWSQRDLARRSLGKRLRHEFRSVR